MEVPAIDNCETARSAGGVKGGGAAERSEGTLDIHESRAKSRTRRGIYSPVDSSFVSLSRSR
jgi:hypothetical protein